MTGTQRTAASLRSPAFIFSSHHPNPSCDAVLLLSHLERIGLLLQQLVSTLGGLLLDLEDLLVHTRGRYLRHGCGFSILPSLPKNGVAKFGLKKGLEMVNWELIFCMSNKVSGRRTFVVSAAKV